MKEIGGYFGLERFSGEEYYPELAAVNNARNALLYIVKARGIRKLYIPYYLCGSVSAVCRREGISLEYYHVDEDFMPVFDGKPCEHESLYIVNYFGRITPEKAKTLKEKYGSIILDNVQAFFQKPVEGIDTVYSCRKFFGVPDGGYAATDAEYPEKLKTDISAGRMKHVLGRFDTGCASDFYTAFRENDESFESLELMVMSELTHNLLRGIDYENVRRKREENYAELERLLGFRNKLSSASPAGPYAYPFYCENGMEIKKRLAQLKIYVPTLWPDVLCMDNTTEKDYAENILPLPVDHRYGAEDMRRVAEAVLKCLE